MPWMMDTSVAIHLRDGTESVVKRAEQRGEGAVISIISLVELENGVYRNPALTVLRRSRLDVLLDELTVLPFEEPAVAAYRTILEASGYSRSRTLDRMVAAQAIASGLPFATTNAADFRDIPGLELEDWS